MTNRDTHTGRRQTVMGLIALAAHPFAAAFNVEAAPLNYTLKPEVIAPGVWLIRGVQEAASLGNGGAIANVTIFDTAAGAVIVDTGPSKRYGTALAALAHELTGKTIARAYLTHIHPDHAFGAQAFGAGLLAATAGTVQGLREMGDDFATAMYKIAGDWMRGTEVVLPGVLVTDRPEDIGERRFRPLALSGHTAADLVLFEEHSGLLLTGDLVFLDRAPTTPQADLTLWRASLKTLDGLDHRLLVPGHGPPEPGQRGIAQTREWLAAIENIITSAFDRGLDMTEAFTEPLPAWTEKIALARYEFTRSVMHLYPQLEAGNLPRVGSKL